VCGKRSADIFAPEDELQTLQAVTEMDTCHDLAVDDHGAL